MMSLKRGLFFNKMLKKEVFEIGSHLKNGGQSGGAYLYTPLC
jgi:hypothetical protein